MGQYVAQAQPTQVSIGNKHRVSCTLFNPNAVDVFVGKNNDITPAGGGNSLPLKANGGSIIFGPPRTYSGDIWIVSSGANNVIFVLEDSDLETRPD